MKKKPLIPSTPLNTWTEAEFNYLGRAVYPMGPTRAARILPELEAAAATQSTLPTRYTRLLALASSQAAKDFVATPEQKKERTQNAILRAIDTHKEYFFKPEMEAMVRKIIKTEAYRDLPIETKKELANLATNQAGTETPLSEILQKSIDNQLRREHREGVRARQAAEKEAAETPKTSPETTETAAKAPEAIKPETAEVKPENKKVSIGNVALAARAGGLRHYAAGGFALFGAAYHAPAMLAYSGFAGFLGAFGIIGLVGLGFYQIWKGWGKTMAATAKKSPSAGAKAEKSEPETEKEGVTATGPSVGMAASAPETQETENPEPETKKASAKLGLIERFWNSSINRADKKAAKTAAKTAPKKPAAGDQMVMGFEEEATKLPEYHFPSSRSDKQGVALVGLIAVVVIGFGIRAQINKHKKHSAVEPTPITTPSNSMAIEKPQDAAPKMEAETQKKESIVQETATPVATTPSAVVEAKSVEPTIYVSSTESFDRELNPAKYDGVMEPSATATPQKESIGNSPLKRVIDSLSSKMGTWANPWAGLNKSQAPVRYLPTRPGTPEAEELLRQVAAASITETTTPAEPAPKLGEGQPAPEMVPNVSLDTGL